MAAGGQRRKAQPAPINAVALNQAIFDLHDFSEVHLVAIGCRSWIFPHQDVAVGEDRIAVRFSLVRLVLEDLGKKFADCTFARTNPALDSQEVSDQRTFDGGIICVERGQRFRVFPRQRVISGLMQALGGVQ